MLDLVEIKEILKNELLSVCKYILNEKEIIVLVLEKINYIELKKLKKTLSKNDFIIFWKDDLLRGTDVFALDFLNIKNNYRLVWGKDFFENLVIDKKYLRHQLEFELRNKMINLRENFIKGKITKDIFPSLRFFFTKIMVGIYFLKEDTKEEIQIDYSEEEFFIELLVINVQEMYKLDVTFIEDILKGETKKIDENFVEELANVLKEIERKVDEV